MRRGRGSRGTKNGVLLHSPRHVPRAAALLVVLAALAYGDALADAATPRRRCDDARYLLPEGLRLTRGTPVADLDAVVVAGRTVGVASGCPAVRARSVVTRKATQLRVTWRAGACRGLRGKVQLVASIDRACDRMKGELRAKHGRQRFTARRSACGDGVRDVAVAEVCPTLEGAVGAAATSAIHDLDVDPGVPPVELTADAQGFQVARTRVEVALVPGATVGDVNAMLARHHAEIVVAVEDVPVLLLRVPDPGSLPALDALVDAIDAEPVVLAATREGIPAPDVLPNDFVPVAGADLTKIDHLLAVRAPAAWNARRAMQSPGAPESWPTVVVADFFGDGELDDAFDVSVPLADFASGHPVNHGHHVLGIIAASFDGPERCHAGAPPLANTTLRGCATGMFPDRLAVRVVDGQLPKYQTIGKVAFGALKRIRDTDGNVVLSTSLNHCALGTCGHPAVAKKAGRVWAEAVRALALEDRFLHVTSAGNVFPGTPNVTDALTNSAFTAAALHPDLSLAGGPAVPNLANVLVVENVVNTAGAPYRGRCLAASSKRPGQIAGIGTNVWSLLGAAALDAAAFAGDLTGTSMSTPEVAGLAAYLWAVDPTMSVAQLRGVLAATAKPLAAAADADCVNVAPQPLIDAYEAILALDQAVLPTPATAPVRHAILDANADGRFDGNDLALFLGAYVDGYVSASQHGALTVPAAPDWGRYDLNGDGVTGGAGTLPFDLDRVGSAHFGAAARTMVTESIGGRSVSFDETALTDLQILCYYAYSGVFEGTPVERTARIDPGWCGGGEEFDFSKVKTGAFSFCIDAVTSEVHRQNGMTEPGGTFEHFCLNSGVDGALLVGNTVSGSDMSDVNDRVTTRSWHATIDVQAKRLVDVTLTYDVKFRGGNPNLPLEPLSHAVVTAHDVPATTVHPSGPAASIFFEAHGTDFCARIDPVVWDQFSGADVSSVVSQQCGNAPLGNFVQLELRQY